MSEAVVTSVLPSDGGKVLPVVIVNMTESEDGKLQSVSSQILGSFSKGIGRELTHVDVAQLCQHATDKFGGVPVPVAVHLINPADQQTRWIMTFIGHIATGKFHTFRYRFIGQWQGTVRTP